MVKPRVRVHATASRAMASRRGVGRVRHLHTQVPWVQEAVARRELTIAKVLGCENPADWDETVGSEGQACNAWSFEQCRLL